MHRDSHFQYPGLLLLGAGLFAAEEEESISNVGVLTSVLGRPGAGMEWRVTIELSAVGRCHAQGAATEAAGQVDRKSAPRWKRGICRGRLAALVRVSILFRRYTACRQEQFMRAIRFEAFGDPSVLEMANVADPVYRRDDRVGARDGGVDQPE